EDVPGTTETGGPLWHVGGGRRSRSRNLSVPVPQPAVTRRSARVVARYPRTMAKLTPKIILEGTRLTHKTDLAFALNEHPSIVCARGYTYHSPLMSAEWCGFTPEPWARGPIIFEGPDEAARAMAVFDAWVRLI